MAPSHLAVGAISGRGESIGSRTRGRRPSLRRLSTEIAPSARRMPPWACWLRPAGPRRLLLLMRPRRLRLPPCLLRAPVGLAGPVLRVLPPLGVAVGTIVRLLRVLTGPPLVSLCPCADMMPPWGLMLWLPARLVRLTYRLAAMAAGVEPPLHFTGVLRCGHRMESMDLCCSMCTGHVVSIEKVMGGSGPAREIVGGIGGPLRPDPAVFLRVDPGGYLRIAADELVRRLSSEGRSALPLSEAIQAAQMLDMFFPRDRVMQLADGDLSRFRRSWSWTYHHAGHLDNPDPGWRYPPLVTVVGALGHRPRP